MIQPRAAKWWIVRAENAEQARKIIKAGYIADKPDEPGLLDSNVVPSLVRARFREYVLHEMARIEQRERTEHLEASGPREGLPRHESPAGMPIEMFASSAIRWGTTEPYWTGEPEAIVRGYDHIPFVVVPAIAAESARSALVPITRQKAIAFADVNGWSVKFAPIIWTRRRRKFTGQDGKGHFGHELEYGFEITAGMTFGERLRLKGYGHWGH